MYMWHTDIIQTVCATFADSRELQSGETATCGSKEHL